MISIPAIAAKTTIGAFIHSPMTMPTIKAMATGSNGASILNIM